MSVDLGDFTGAPDGVVDTLAVAGSPADDPIDISADAGAVVVAGLAASMRITGADLFDQLAVHGGSGAESFARAGRRRPHVGNDIRLDSRS